MNKMIEIEEQYRKEKEMMELANKRWTKEYEDRICTLQRQVYFLNKYIFNRNMNIFVWIDLI